MKKKGLIVATIVMVLVLAVSITTATYAWFSISATAELSSIQLTTAASSGLQVAIWSGSETKTYKSGDASLPESGDKIWTATDDGWGSQVVFSNIPSVYGVSGDGATMYIPSADNGVDEAISTTAFGTASQNVQYFTANIALLNTKSEAQDLYAELAITPTANAANLVGMAAALRIAFLAEDDTLIAVVNPYANIAYSKSATTWGAGTESTQYLTKAEGKETVATYADLSKTAFADAKVVEGTQNANAPAAYTGANRIVVKLASNVGANTGTLNMKVVMWYEGEDAECIKLFAGGGATVGMLFEGVEVGAAAPTPAAA